MKTYILQLELHDDIVSAKDKMEWGKSGRILVVWPEHGSLLNRRLDLLLLKRHADALGSQIAVVTRDSEVRYHAPRLGIPVFRNQLKAQSAPWRVPHRFRLARTAASLSHSAGEHLSGNITPESRKRAPLNPPPRSRPQPHPVIRIGLFFTSVLAFLLVAALLLPSAQIDLAPAIQEQTVSIAVQASPQNPAIQLSGLVPAHWISATVEGRDSLSASSTVSIPDQSAAGEVVFTNLTDSPVSIPSGMVVRSPGPGAPRFEVTRAGRVSAGPGTRLTLPVRCLTLGTAGNLPPGRLTAIEGLLGTQLSVTNPLPTQGGSVRSLPAPDERDRKELSERLQQALTQTARNEILNRLADDDLLIISSVHLAQVLDETYQPESSEPADQLQLTLRAEFGAYVVLADDLHTLAVNILDASLPEGFIPIEASLEITNLGTPDFVQDTARWRLEASRMVEARITEAQAKGFALGQAPEAASQRLLANLPLRDRPAIRLTPGWWPRMPYLPFQIQIRIVGAKTAWVP
jgi:hypothetical protein